MAIALVQTVKGNGGGYGWTLTAATSRNASMGVSTYKAVVGASKFNGLLLAGN